MKGTELQIGDYVWYTDPDCDQTHICEVRGILPNGRIGIWFKGYQEVTDNKLKPIDITDEIMELNDFKKRGMAVGKGHWWLRMYGDKKVSVNLHEFNGQFYAFDYWIEQPFGDTTQTMFCTVWFDHSEDMLIVKKPVRHMDAGDAHGIHLLQHAMRAAGISHNWIFTREERQ